MEGSRALGDLIRETRLEKGMSLSQLAAAVGRSSSSVRRWERGEVAPALTVIPDLARVLELDEGALSALRPALAGDDTPGESAAAAAEPPKTGVDTALRAELPDQQGRSRASGVFADAFRALVESRPVWVGWVRGVATAVFIIVMVVVAVWAMGQLWDAVRSILDSFDIGGAS